MPGPPAVRVVLSTRQRKILKKLRRQRTLSQCLVWRINIVLRAAKGIGHKLRVGLDVKASIASKMAEPSGLRLRLTRPKGLAWAT